MTDVSEWRWRGWRLYVQRRQRSLWWRADAHWAGQLDQTWPNLEELGYDTQVKTELARTWAQMNWIIFFFLSMGVTTPMAFGLLLLRSWQRDDNLAVDGGDLRVMAVYVFGDVLPNLSLLFFLVCCNSDSCGTRRYTTMDGLATSEQWQTVFGNVWCSQTTNREALIPLFSVTDDVLLAASMNRDSTRSAKKETQQRTVAARTSSGMIRAVLPIRHYEQWCSGQQTPAIRSLWSSFRTMRLGFSHKQRKTCSNTMLEKKRKTDMNEFRIQCGWLDFLLIISLCMYNYRRNLHQIHNQG